MITFLFTEKAELSQWLKWALYSQCCTWPENGKISGGRKSLMVEANLNQRVCEIWINGKKKVHMYISTCLINIFVWYELDLMVKLASLENSDGMYDKLKSKTNALLHYFTSKLPPSCSFCSLGIILVSSLCNSNPTLHCYYSYSK